MEKYIITALIVWIIISTVLLLFVIVSVSKNKTKQERELEDREQEEFVSSLKKANQSTAPQRNPRCFSDFLYVVSLMANG